MPEMVIGNRGIYTPDLQPSVDKARLRYAELLAETDAAFGAFLGGLKQQGRLDDTAIIVSADHGESFVGGVYQHGGPNQVRQIAHIPLIVRLPGDDGRRQVAKAFDQTSLAPTILHIAGARQPAWMGGGSLLGPEAAASGGGLAFTQYFEESSAFGTPRRGTVGVIDGQNQYVLSLPSGRGLLRPLSEAHLRGADHSGRDPAMAAALRGEILARFPSLGGVPA
jgi:arylsulfatase A-like enzyme